MPTTEAKNENDDYTKRLQNSIVRLAIAFLIGFILLVLLVDFAGFGTWFG